MGKRIHQVIIGGEVMLLCMVVALLSTQAASANPPSNGVSYNKNGQVTVENALDNLYSKVNYGDAEANEILKGKKALVGGKEVVGTFTCPTLASLTPGDATPEDITDGKIAWVNGNKVVGVEERDSTIAEIVKVGDYINYYPPTSQISIDYSIIYPSKTERWRVIYINPEDGSVEIVPQWTDASFLQIQGVNYTSAMDKILDGYFNPNLARRVRLITRNDKDLIKKEFGNLKFFNANGETVSYWTGIFDETVKNWPYYITKDGETRVYTMQTSDTKNNHAIRPIITLKANIDITGGQGTYSYPYRIQKKS